MAKHLKDIVEEGFARLESLAEKRREILYRADQIASSTTGDHTDSADSKLRHAETSLMTEMESKSKQLLSELEKTLSDEDESGRHFLESGKSRLKLKISGTLTELAQTKAHLLDGSVERLDSLFQELEKDSDVARRHLQSEVERLLADLASSCKANHAKLLQTQSEVEAKLSEETQPLMAELAKTFQWKLEAIEKRRSEIVEELDKMHAQQVKRLAENLNESALTPILREQFASMKQSCVGKEQEMSALQDETYTQVTELFSKTGKESLETLQNEYENSRTATISNLEDLKSFKSGILKQQQSYFSDRSQEVKVHVEAICSELITQSGGTASNNKVDAAFMETSTQLNSLTGELNNKLENLLQSQAEGLSKLGQSTSRNFSNLLQDFKTQMQDMLKQQELLCQDKEQSLLKQLAHLEEQVARFTESNKSEGSIELNGGSSE